MATETRYIAKCDRCGAEETAPEPDALPETWTFVELNGGETKADLCRGCSVALESFLDNLPDEAEPDEEPPF